MPPDDSHDGTDSLVARARAGDRAAFEALLEQVRASLEVLAQRLLGARLRARVRVSDVVQSACCDVIEGFKDYAGQSPRTFDAWVSQILRNNLRKKGRHFNAEKRREPAAVRGTEAAGAAAEPPATDPARTDSDELSLVAQALARLEERQRRVLTWRLLEGRDYKEIAEIERTSLATARSLVFRARAALSVEVARLRGPRS